jgi:hypothetical protein
MPSFESCTSEALKHTKSSTFVETSNNNHTTMLDFSLMKIVHVLKPLGISPIQTIPRKLIR